MSYETIKVTSDVCQSTVISSFTWFLPTSCRLTCPAPSQCSNKPSNACQCHRPATFCIFPFRLRYDLGFPYLNIRIPEIIKLENQNNKISYIIIPRAILLAGRILYVNCMEKNKKKEKKKRQTVARDDNVHNNIIQHFYVHEAQLPRAIYASIYSAAHATYVYRYK